jgi:hypothetical protein
VFLQRLAHLPERGVVTELGIELAMIDDVVAVGAAGPSLEVGRQVGVADAQCLQVRRHVRHLFEAEAVMQLQAVGGARNYGVLPV